VRGNGIFSHEALFYSGEEEFLAGVMPFVRDGIAAGEPMLIALHDAKIQRIKSELNGELNGEYRAVQFADMEELGRNPACIIPAWRDFVAEHEGRAIRGIGEPIWPGRSDAELAECHHHEALLNLAFDGRAAFRLLCPYDGGGLEAEVLEEAQRTHPMVLEGDECRASDAYVAPAKRGLLVEDLLPPSGTPRELRFRREELRDVRRFVSEHAEQARLSDTRASDLVLAVSELATNSVLHAGGGGTVTLWSEINALVCEVRDAGLVEDPLVGRERPAPERASGRGLWLVNNLCDLVQMRTFAGGTVVRVQMLLSAAR
jgi:anti-sigma regulatory factor (Ser/Thr protein kinase)